MSFDKGFHDSLLRVDGADTAAVFPLGLGPKCVSFRKQTAGIDRHDVDIQGAFLQHVKDRLVLRSEACGEDDFAGDLAAKTLKPLAGMQRSKTVVQSRRKRDQNIAVRDDIRSFFISTTIRVGDQAPE